LFSSYLAVAIFNEGASVLLKVMATMGSQLGEMQGNLLRPATYAVTVKSTSAQHETQEAKEFITEL